MVDVIFPYELVGGSRAVAKQVMANLQEISKGFAGINTELEQLKKVQTEIQRKPTRDMFDVYFNFSGKAPTGAYPLWTGELVTNCRTIYRDFWKQALVFKTGKFIRTGTQEEYDKEVEEFGETGMFVIDELNGHIRLPKITHFISSIAELSDNGSIHKDTQQPFFDEVGGFTGHFSSTSGDDKRVKVVVTNGDSVRGVGTGWNSAKLVFDDRKINRTGDFVQPRHVKLCLYLQVANNIADISEMDTTIIAQQLSEAIGSLSEKRDQFSQELLGRENELRQLTLDLQSDLQDSADLATAEFNSTVEGKYQQVTAAATEAKASCDSALLSSAMANEQAVTSQTKAQEAAASAGLAQTNADEIKSAVSSVQEAVDKISGLDTNIVSKIDDFNTDYVEKLATVTEQTVVAMGQAKRAETEANRAEASAELAKGVDLGTVLASVKTVVPVGALWCDGSEWVQAQFPDFYGKLVNGEIKSTDYSTFNNAIQTCGWCGVCAVDTVNKKFKTAKITNNAQIGIIPNEDNKNLGRFLVEEKSFSAPYGGYEIYSDGFMIQWRKDPFPSGVNSTNGNTIFLYKPYKDATYNILGIASMNAAGTYPTGEGIISLRKEAFIFRVVSGANNANTQVRDYAWETRGYSDYAFLEDPKYYITIYNGAVQPSMAQAAEFIEKITALQNGIGFSTAGKEMFLEQEDLDYSRASAVTITTTPTIIKKRGYLLGATYIGGATPQDLLINNVVVAKEAGEFCNIQMRVVAGDSVKVSANGSSNITFIPLKGAL